MSELRTKLRAAGQRMTPQRELLYQALCAATEHPTAEELFLRVRESTPSISLATVYNTLEMLVSRGLALKINVEGPARYDATCAPHGHARCVRCGLLEDLPGCADPGVGSIPLPAGFVPQAVTVEVEGLCAACHASTQQEMS